MSLQQLLDPQSIAVIGASKDKTKVGYAAMRNATEFDGPVYPVNPRASGHLFGRDFVGSVNEIEGSVDLALVCVPPPVVPDVLRECGEKEIGGAVIFAGGFSEATDEGEELESEIKEIADENGISLLGPNTSGFISPSTGVRASFVPHVERIPAGDTSIVAQSGGINHALAFESYSDGRGLSKAIGLGNRANTGFQEVIRYLDGDENTNSIVVHIEGTDDARGLVETCREIDTPVVAYKVGKEDVGDFARSHTGSLTGDYDLYQAAFSQYGVPTVRSCLELLDVGYALARSPEPKGTNVGVVTAQAGPGIAITDRLKSAGANLPRLSEETQDEIEKVLPGITFSDNPVDTGRPMPEFGDVVEAVARDENIDIVVVYELYEEGLDYPVGVLDGLAEDTGKPILFVTDGPSDIMEDAINDLERVVPTFRTPERGADAVCGLVRYARMSNRGKEVVDNE
ncbi:MAG: CoA-binding protein [Halobacteria archaeon]|nr:CoA-binding protein [Halobacteria archaeon]